MSRKFIQISNVLLFTRIKIKYPDIADYISYKFIPDQTLFVIDQNVKEPYVTDLGVLTLKVTDFDVFFKLYKSFIHNISANHNIKNEVNRFINSLTGEDNGTN